MIRLRTLGSVDLRTEDGAQADAVLRQPKRLALLIYLALDGPVFHRRDRLLALFWPEADEKGARGSLSQAVFQLRAALGKHVIVGRGDEELGIGEGALWSDVVAFNEALDKGDPQEAISLYRGDLLPSFGIGDAPEFEDWLSTRRQKLAVRAADACVQLAERAAKPAEAVQWLRRAISIQPFEEGAHQKLIAALDRAGDRAAALRAFEDLRALLEEEFGAEPAAETLDLVRAVRTRASSGALLASSVAAPAITNIPVETVSEHVGPSATARGKIRLFGYAGGTIALLLLAWVLTRSREPKAYKPPADHVAVLYFNDDSPHHDLAYLTESLTSTLIDQLGQVRQLRVISQNGVRPYRGRSVPIDSIARELDAGTIVGGSVTESNDRLRVTVEMIDATTGAVMRSRTLERSKGELFALLDDLSAEVSSFLRVTVGQEVRLEEWRAQTRSVDAWRTLQEAEYLRSTADEKENSGNLSEAQTLLARSDSLSARALELDRRFGSAIVLRGRIAERRGWQEFMMGKPDRSGQYFSTSQAFANRALAIDAANANAYELRGSVNYWVWLLTPPRTGADSLLKAAERDLRKSLQLSKERPRAESVLSTVLLSQGNFREARAAALRALEADAYLADADQIVSRLFETSFEIGDDVEAGHWCDEMRRRAAGHWQSAWCDLMLLAWSREGNHDPRKAMHLLETFGAEDAEPLRASMQPRLLALSAAVVARAGMPDSANAMLARARSQAPHDIELLHLEAAARMLMDDNARAVALLQSYLRVNPRDRLRIVNGRIFKNVRNQIS